MSSSVATTHIPAPAHLEYSDPHASLLPMPRPVSSVQHNGIKAAVVVRSTVQGNADVQARLDAMKAKKAAAAAAAAAAKETVTSPPPTMPVPDELFGDEPEPPVASSSDEDDDEGNEMGKHGDQDSTVASQPAPIRGPAVKCPRKSVTPAKPTAPKRVAEDSDVESDADDDESSSDDDCEDGDEEFVQSDSDAAQDEAEADKADDDDSVLRNKNAKAKNVTKKYMEMIKNRSKSAASKSAPKKKPLSAPPTSSPPKLATGSKKISEKQRKAADSLKSVNTNKQALVPVAAPANTTTTLATTGMTQDQQLALASGDLGSLVQLAFHCQIVAQNNINALTKQQSLLQETVSMSIKNLENNILTQGSNFNDRLTALESKFTDKSNAVALNVSDRITHASSCGPALICSLMLSGALAFCSSMPIRKALQDSDCQISEQYRAELERKVASFPGAHVNVLIMGRVDPNAKPKAANIQDRNFNPINEVYNRMNSLMNQDPVSGTLVIKFVDPFDYSFKGFTDCADDMVQMYTDIYATHTESSALRPGRCDIRLASMKGEIGNEERIPTLNNTWMPVPNLNDMCSVENLNGITNVWLAPESLKILRTFFQLPANTMQNMQSMVEVLQRCRLFDFNNERGTGKRIQAKHKDVPSAVLHYFGLDSNTTTCLYYNSLPDFVRAISGALNGLSHKEMFNWQPRCTGLPVSAYAMVTVEGSKSLVPLQCSNFGKFHRGKIDMGAMRRCDQSNLPGVVEVDETDIQKYTEETLALIAQDALSDSPKPAKKPARSRATGKRKRGSQSPVVAHNDITIPDVSDDGAAASGDVPELGPESDVADDEVEDEAVRPPPAKKQRRAAPKKKSTPAAAAAAAAVEEKDEEPEEEEAADEPMDSRIIEARSKGQKAPALSDDAQSVAEHARRKNAARLREIEAEAEAEAMSTIPEPVAKTKSGRKINRKAPADAGEEIVTKPKKSIGRRR